MDISVSIDFAQIARDVGLPLAKVERTVELLDEGNTVPFITRYRKDQTGGLDEEQIRSIQTQTAKSRQLAERKQTILKSIEAQSKLTPELAEQIKSVRSPKHLEDLYLPFRPRKQTLATVARQRGLEPLAQEILDAREGTPDLETLATPWVSEERELASVSEVLAGVGHLLAERFSERADLRGRLRRILNKTGKLVTQRIEPAAEKATPPTTGDAAPAGESGSSPQDAAGQETAVQETAPQDAAANETAATETAATVEASETSSPQPAESGSPESASAETSETASSETASPEAASPEAASPEAASPEAASPEAASSETASSETASSEAAGPEAASSEATNPEAASPEAATSEQTVTAPGADATPTSASEGESKSPPAAQKKQAPPQKKAAKSARGPKSAAAREARKKKKQQMLEAAFKDYYQFEESIGRLPPHRVLAINRGERAKILRVKLEADLDQMVREAERLLIPPDHAYADFLRSCVRDALNRLVLPSLERDIRRELTDKSEQHAVQVFIRNLRKLLLQPPVANRRVLAIDPGFRSGCKVIALDECGNVLAQDLFHVVGNEERQKRSRQKLAKMIRQQKIAAVAIGNGTACRETEQLVARVIEEEFKDSEIAFVIVNEAGASVYSTSPLGREELPDHDASVRSAISIGRRLLDPLSELVKINPSNIGVGLYQHDVKAKHLRESLDAVVESCVNYVGVDVNTASPALLRYVSGLNQLTARRLYEYRRDNGPFRNREQFKQVPNFGDATFVQAAGFLKISGGDNPLDATWIHPESYAVAERLLEKLGSSVAELAALVAPPPKPVPVPIAPAAVRTPATSAAAAGDAAAGDAAPGDVAASDVAPSDAAAGDAAAGDAAPGDAAPGDAAPSDVAASDVAPSDVAPSDAAAGDAAASDAAPGDVAPSDIAPSDVAPSDIAPSDVAPSNVAPSDVAPGDAAASDTAASDTAASDTAATDTAASDTAPSDAAPSDAAPAEETPAAETSTQPAQETPAPSSAESPQAESGVLSPTLAERVEALELSQLAGDLEVGEMLLRDMVNSLARPGRDPREDLPPPVFRRGIMKLEDLAPGMELSGTVLNVVDFGAFVDIGLSDSGLVHISRLADRYVKDPHEVVSVGDAIRVWVVEIDKQRRRVSLTAVQPGTETPPSQRRKPSREGGGSGGSGGGGGGGKPRKAKRATPARGRSKASSRGSGGRDRSYTQRPKARPPQPVKPITKEMEEGNEPMRSFSDLLQFYDKKRDDDDGDKA